MGLLFDLGKQVMRLLLCLRIVEGRSQRGPRRREITATVRQPGDAQVAQRIDRVEP